jgi:hypothetical protein
MVDDFLVCFGFVHVTYPESVGPGCLCSYAFFSAYFCSVPWGGIEAISDGLTLHILKKALGSSSH